MIINGNALLEKAPIANMQDHKISEHGVSWGLTEAGYDIRIKQDIIFKPREMASCYILRDSGYVNGRFVLASSMEEFQMPPDLFGEVKDKSTWARQSLSLFNTVIEPGWHGYLTLELVFFGSQEVVIPAGSGIAQVIFSPLVEARPYKGKYQNQPDDPTPSRFI